MNDVHDIRRYQVAEKRPDPHSEAAARAPRERTETAHEESAKTQTGPDECLRELSKETEETRRAVLEMVRMVEGEARFQNYTARGFFYEALRKERRIGALRFDEIYRDFEAKHDGRSTEYDLLLTSDELVAAVEVKQDLCCENVEDVRKVRAPNARFYLRHFSDRKLLFVMAYMTADADAVTLAREYGYATLSPDGQKVRADTRCVRYVALAEHEERMSNVYDMRSYQIAEKRPDPYSEAATRARWARIEAAHEEIAKMHARLDERLQKMSEETEETKQVVRESLRELSKQVKETSRVARKTSEEWAKTQAELAKEAEETRRVARDTSRIVGNMGRTQGRIAEEFFYEALHKTLHIGTLKFDDVRANIKVARAGRSAEYDLILTNGEIVAVVEVKHKLRHKDVEHIRETLAPNFRFLLPEWRGRKLLLAVAYMTAAPEVVTLARECGCAVLSPDGQKARADTSCVRYIRPAEHEERS